MRRHTIVPGVEKCVIGEGKGIFIILPFIILLCLRSSRFVHKPVTTRMCYIVSDFIAPWPGFWFTLIGGKETVRLGCDRLTK